MARADSRQLQGHLEEGLETHVGAHVDQGVGCAPGASGAQQNEGSGGGGKAIELGVSA